GFTLGRRENARLDRLLADRFRGNFALSGRRIWSEIHGLPEDLLAKARRHRQVVAVFTNVAWDTSQAYANAFLDDMFGWLDATLGEARVCPDTLFVVRAHPDELRKGSSSETVADWLEARGCLR